MSITFTPEAGTWAAVIYYEDREDPSGFYRSVTDQPSINCHNSGGHLLQAALGIEDPDYCGRIEADGIQGALDSFRNRKRFPMDAGDQAYLLRKSDEVEQVLFHCLFHKCGLTFG